MKNLITITIILAFINVHVYAQSVLTKMPYNIVIGETKNEAIESKAVCTDRIKVNASYFRCASYSFANKFVVKSSQNETIMGIDFDISDGHRLPKSWRKLGITLGVKGSSSGTSFEKFKAILESENIMYNVSKDDFYGQRISFELEGLEYIAIFANRDMNVTVTRENSPNEDKFTIYKGLKSISITESY